ncbi:hypothetical protein DXX93_02905 [Thalassotalea euphylliae]|uniref:DUF481 domain-containing protein n=1 Tax=Thalassotalea euphylliae TaxID=1655234 RepID=A0A3E0TM21_9GAMM|nr:hypothetical protein [Thalassotalea euphylliae]REL25601.1 hypothetical protein DXX93_02905 [Thalassotalea euphylliae]
MKKILATLLSTLVMSTAAAEPKVERELAHNEKTSLSVGLMSFDSSELDGQSLGYETTLLRLGKTRFFGEKSSLYMGTRYLTGETDNTMNSDLTESESYVGLRMSFGGDNWLFIEEGYLVQKEQTTNQFFRANSDVLRFGIENNILTNWLSEHTRLESGINIRVAIEMYDNFDEDYEGYRIDLGYKSPFALFYQNDFSNNEPVFGINFTHTFK